MMLNIAQELRNSQYNPVYVKVWEGRIAEAQNRGTLLPCHWKAPFLPSTIMTTVTPPSQDQGTRQNHQAPFHCS